MLVRYFQIKEGINIYENNDNDLDFSLLKTFI